MVVTGQVDKLGRPVYIVRMGLIDPGALLQASTCKGTSLSPYARTHPGLWVQALMDQCSVPDVGCNKSVESSFLGRCFWFLICPAIRESG